MCGFVTLAIIHTLKCWNSPQMVLVVMSAMAEGPNTRLIEPFLGNGGIEMEDSKVSKIVLGFLHFFLVCLIMHIYRCLYSYVGEYMKDFMDSH